MAWLVLLGFALPLIIFLLVLNKTKKYWLNSNLPPGNSGWPLLGETLIFASTPAKFIRDRMLKYSPDVFQTSIGGAKMVVFCGASGNKFVFSNGVKLKNWLPRSVAKVLSVPANYVDNKSETSRLYYKQLHDVLKVGSMEEFVRVMDTKAREHIEKHWVPYNEVKVQPLSKDYGFSLACTLFISYKTDVASIIAKPFYNLIQQLLSVPVNLPGTTYNRALKASSIVRNHIIDLIRRRRSELLSEPIHVDGTTDFLSRMLLAWHEEFSDKSMDVEELAGFIMSLLFAGFNSTSTTIAFALSHLAEYPDVYAKVLQEQSEIVQSKRKGELLTLKDIEKMKYTWNVVCESMRLKPPVVGGFKEVVADISYAGYQIPKGHKVHWNVYSTHMDPTYFPNPEKFDPSRFEGKLPPGAFVPFGGGSHMCCGKEFARMETLIYLHHLVMQFKLSKANPSEKIIYKPLPTAVEGLRIRLEPHAS